MAFENVFGNVDFGQISRARQNEANQLQQAIGLGMAQGQAAQDRDLKLRQLEMDAAEDAVNFKKLGPQAIMKKLQGLPTTPQEDAAAALYDAINTGAAQFDALGRPIGTRGSPMDALGMQQGMGIPQQPQAGLPPQTGFGGIPPVNLGADISGLPPSPEGARLDVGMIEPIDTAQLGSGNVPYNAPQDVVSTDVNPVDYKGPFEESVPAITGEIGGNIELQVFEGKKNISSIYEDEKLNKASVKKQKSYENLLGDLLKGYEGLIEAGGAVKTLSDDSNISDIAKNIAASAGASRAGQAIGGALGTKAQGSRDEINRTIPMMFGDLRMLMGMTGKELDTQRERDFYLNALSDPSTNMETNLNIIEGLSDRFGDGKTSAKIDDLRKMLRKDKGDSPEQKFNRLQELRSRAGQ